MHSMPVKPRRRNVGALLVVTAFLCACEDPPDDEYTWEGIWHVSPDYSNTGSFKATIEQRGTELSGTLEISGMDIGSNSLQGTIEMDYTANHQQIQRVDFGDTGGEIEFSCIIYSSDVDDDEKMIGSYSSDNGNGYWYTTSDEKPALTARSAISLSIERPAAIAFDGADFWVAGEAGEQTTLYRVDQQGQTLDSFTAPAAVQDLTFDGTDIWIASSHEGLFQVDTSGNTINTYTNAFLQPWGIAFVEDHLVATDFMAGKINELDLAGNITGSAGNAGRTLGLAYDGTHLWAAYRSYEDSWATIGKMETNGTTLTTYYAPCKDPSGLVFASDALWVIDTVGMAFEVTVE